MGIEAKISNQLDANNVQVNISTSKSKNIKYYKVPANKADSFIANYKKNDKKISIITNGAFVTSILASVLLANKFTKNVKNTMLRWVIDICAGIAGATASIIGCSNFIEKSSNKVLKEHNTEEIYYK